MNSKKPNILLIICDQFRWDCLSIMGHPTVDTPYLDELASEGVLFRSAYSPSPSCIPARACLFTGKDPNHTGFLGYRDCQEWTFQNMLPEVMRDNGYQTHCVGKTHFYPQWKRCGFEGLDSYEAWQNFDGTYVNDYHEWLKEKTNGRLSELHTGVDDNSWIARPSTLPEELHNNTWVITKGLEFIRRRDKTRPYFLNLSFHRPHSPIDPPLAFWEMYRHRECESIPIGNWAERHNKPVHSITCWEGRLSKQRLKEMRLAYYAQIAHIDNQIGRFLRELKALGEMPDLIVFTSDHGDMLGDHHLFRKTYAYEGSAAVPLMIWSKQHKASIVRDEAVVLQDIYPTILKQAGIELPEGVDGLDLSPLFAEEGKIDREWIQGEHARCYSDAEAMQFLTDGHMKYIWFTATNEEQLFNLKHDPYECENLASLEVYQETLKVWRERMIQYLATRPEDKLSDGNQLICGLTPVVRK